MLRFTSRDVLWLMVVVGMPTSFPNVANAQPRTFKTGDHVYVRHMNHEGYGVVRGSDSLFYIVELNRSFGSAQPSGFHSPQRLLVPNALGCRQRLASEQFQVTGNPRSILQHRGVLPGPNLSSRQHRGTLRSGDLADVCQDGVLVHDDGPGRRHPRWSGGSFVCLPTN
jgi:hypothetical protein